MPERFLIDEQNRKKYNFCPGLMLRDLDLTDLSAVIDTLNGIVESASTAPDGATLMQAGQGRWSINAGKHQRWRTTALSDHDARKTQHRRKIWISDRLLVEIVLGRAPSVGDAIVQPNQLCLDWPDDGVRIYTLFLEDDEKCNTTGGVLVEAKPETGEVVAQWRSPFDAAVFRCEEDRLPEPDDIGDAPVELKDDDEDDLKRDAAT